MRKLGKYSRTSFIQKRDVGGVCSMCGTSAPNDGRAAAGGGTVHVLRAGASDRDGVYYALACTLSDSNDGCYEALVREQLRVAKSTDEFARHSANLLGAPARSFVNAQAKWLGHDPSGAPVVLLNQLP